jgi:bifunctional non-homologous end joining protein LigD
MRKRNAATAVRGRKEGSARGEKSPPARADASKTGASSGVRLTHPDRLVYPGTSFRKQDVAAYYIAAMPWMLPELARRPLSVLRCPDGAGAACFFQKHRPDQLGASVASIRLREKGGGSDEYFYVEDARGVLELVQMNTIEFHPWGARIDDPDRPDRLVFDLDPAPDLAWKDLVAAAKDVRATLADAGLESWARLSGGKGVHVVVPIRRGPSWDDAKAFCEAIATSMAAAQPSRYLASASKARREGRIFIDWLRNTRGATSVASWSLRARVGAPVAMPIRWDELSRTKGSGAFDLAAATKRAKALRKDPWQGFAESRQVLPGASRRRR